MVFKTSGFNMRYLLWRPSNILMFLAEMLVFALHYIWCDWERFKLCAWLWRDQTHYKLTDSRRECTKHFVLCILIGWYLASQGCWGCKRSEENEPDTKFRNTEEVREAGVIIISQRAHKALNVLAPFLVTEILTRT